MTCPPEVAEIILKIIRIGLLRIRALGWQDDARRCAAEADHLHNLPSLLTRFSPDLLRFYWDVERPSFLDRCGEGGHPVDEFEEPWARLARIMADEPLRKGSA